MHLARFCDEPVEVHAICISSRFEFHFVGSSFFRQRFKHSSYLLAFQTVNLQGYLFRFTQSETDRGWLRERVRESSQAEAQHFFSRLTRHFACRAWTQRPIGMLQFLSHILILHTMRVRTSMTVAVAVIVAMSMSRTTRNGCATG